jgi:hypothetical protein
LQARFDAQLGGLEAEINDPTLQETYAPSHGGQLSAADSEAAAALITGRRFPTADGRPDLGGAWAEQQAIQDPLLRAIQATEEGHPAEDGTLPKQEILISDIPGAIILKPVENEEDLRSQDDLLKALSNAKLRDAFHANIDAEGLVTESEEKQAVRRTLTILGLEAERRGLNLDTGEHVEDLATDPDRAAIHTDQDTRALRELSRSRRKIITRYSAPNFDLLDAAQCSFWSIENGRRGWQPSPLQLRACPRSWTM